MKKDMKKTYFLVIGIIGLITIISFSTYAMFTQDINIGQFVSITAGSISTESSITEYERITIDSNDSKTIDLNITNSTSNSLYYGVWYEMVNPDTINSNIKIGKLIDSTNATTGQLASNGNITVHVCIVNNSSADIIINIGVGYSSTSSLNLPIGRTIITGETAPSINFVDYLNSVFNDASKTNINAVGDSIIQASSVNLEEDSFGNIRYYGASPNNYVTFNNELWRIIGVFNVDSTYKIKLIKSNDIGDYIYSNTTNDWYSSSLKTYLNGTYYSNINTDYKNMIQTTTYYLGGMVYPGNWYAKDLYNNERSNTVYSGNHTTSSDKIAVMYPSDYAYATDLNTCTKTTSTYSQDTTNCINKNWMYINHNTSHSTEWTITHDSSIDWAVFLIDSRGNVTYDANSNDVTENLYTRPVLYLKSAVRIYDIGRNGSSSSPFLITCYNCS